MQKKDLLYYLMAMGLFVGLKFGYTIAGNDDLLFLLWPTNFFIELATGSEAAYRSDTGFFHESLNVIIDRSCSGVNFWLLCFMMLLYLLVNTLSTRVLRIAAFPVALLMAYFLTLVVNTSRIMISLLLERRISFSASWLHQAEGAFIYLTFLILIYLGMNALLEKKMEPNEKLA